MGISTPHFRMVDRMLDGGLEGLLRESRAAGISWEEIARRLYADHGVPISGATIRSWGKRLDIPDPEPNGNHEPEAAAS